MKTTILHNFAAKMVMWSKRVKFCEDEIKELSGLARKIANLPERA